MGGLVVGASYDGIAGRFDEVRTRLQNKEVEYLGMLVEGMEEGGTILDLGCGTGRPIAVHLASLGYRIVGVDASEAMLGIARRLLPGHRWIHARIEEVEIEEKFGAVVCWDSLFHLPRRHFAPVIRKVHRWLVPGGRLMVSSGGLVDEDGDGFTDTMFGHEFYYDSLSPRQMVATIRDTGFEIVLAEMCDLPDGGRNKGKWATIASRNPDSV